MSDRLELTTTPTTRTNWIRTEVSLDDKRTLRMLARRESIKTDKFVSVEDLVGKYVREGMTAALVEMEHDSHVQ